MSGSATGYEDGAIVKPAVWTWEVPVYFFVGGAAGMAGLIAGVVFLVADARGELSAALPVVGPALWIAVVGAALSPPLLISDLGRPARFLNMLRRFNRRSPLSVGVWILIAFSATASLALWLHGSRSNWSSWPPAPAWIEGLLPVSLLVLVPLGGLLATYTGVLLAATVVPAWNRHRSTLPLHFGLASLGVAAACLVLVVGVGSTVLVRVLGAAVVLDGLLEARMRVAPRDEEVAVRAAAPVLVPAAFVLLCLSLGLERTGAVVVLVAGLMGRFHWVRMGRLTSAAPAARGRR